MALGFQFKANTKSLRRALARLDKAMLKEVGEDLDRFTLNVLRDSKTREPRVPVDTGALQSTGRPEPALRRGDTLRAAVIYGGVAGPPWNKEVDYAVVTHDDANATYHRPLAGPKYVSTHWERRTPKLVRDINATLKKKFRGGVGGERLF